MPQPGSRLAAHPVEVAGILKKSQRLAPLSGLARDQRAVARIRQGNPRPGPRTHLARGPREVGRAVGPPAVARASAQRHRARRSASRRSSPGCPPATSPASSLCSSSGTQAGNTRAVDRRRADEDETIFDRSDRDAAEPCSAHRCRTSSSKPLPLHSSSALRARPARPEGRRRRAAIARFARDAATSEAGPRRTTTRGGSFLESRTGYFRRASKLSAAADLVRLGMPVAEAARVKGVKRTTLRRFISGCTAACTAVVAESSDGCVARRVCAER